MFLFLKTRRSSLRCWCLPWLLSIFELPCITLFVYTVSKQMSFRIDLCFVSNSLFNFNTCTIFAFTLKFCVLKKWFDFKNRYKKIDIHVFQFTHHFQHMISLNVIQYVTWKTKIIWRLIFSPIIHKYLWVI